MLGIKEIQEIIPHRHPFLLIDCIEERERLDINQLLTTSRFLPATFRRSRLCRAC